MLSHRDTRYTHVINVCSCILDLLAPMVDLSVALVVALLYKNINVIIPHLVSLFCRCDSRLVAPAPHALPWRRVGLNLTQNIAMVRHQDAGTGRRTNLIQKTQDSRFVLKIKCQVTLMGLNLRVQENPCGSTSSLGYFWVRCSHLNRLVGYYHAAFSWLTSKSHESSYLRSSCIWISNCYDGL